MAKGRIGATVYYIRRGQQIARSLAQEVTNPQSAAQMAQRTGWANLVHFYQNNDWWMKYGAFAEKKTEWSDYNAFVSANAKNSDVNLTKEQSDAGCCVVAPYTVSKGTLKTVKCEYDADMVGIITDLYVGDLDITNATTVAELSEALLLNNSGLMIGDQLSFVVNVQTGSAEFPFIEALAQEITIDTDETRTLEEVGATFVSNYENAANLNCLAVSTEDTGVPTVEACGATVIVSRQTSAGLKVSTQALVMTNTTFLANYQGDTARQRAARSYGGAQRSNFLTPGYYEGGERPTMPLAIVSVNGVRAGEGLRWKTYSGLIDEYDCAILFNQAIPATVVRSSVYADLGSSPHATTTTVVINGSTAIATFEGEEDFSNLPFNYIEVTMYDAADEVVFEGRITFAGS